jgi:hypothetical protein
MAERKYFDVVSATPFNVDDTGTVPASISNIAQGTSDTTRVGDTVNPFSLEYSLMLKYNNTNTTTNLNVSLNFLRLIIFRWSPFFTDVAPTVGKILTYFTVGYAASAPLVHDGRNQFELLVDRRAILDGATRLYKEMHGTVTLNGPIQYKAGSTTNQSGGIYFLVISDAATGGAVYPSVQYNSFRINYRDS